MANDNVKVGPMDPNAPDPEFPARLTGAGANPSASAQDLIAFNRAQYPVDLVAVASLPTDYEATEKLDLGKIKLPDHHKDGQIISARVQGMREKVVTYLVEFDSGRTVRGFLPYADVVGKREAQRAGGGNAATKRGQRREAQPDSASGPGATSGGDEPNDGSDAAPKDA